MRSERYFELNLTRMNLPKERLMQIAQVLVINKNNGWKKYDIEMVLNDYGDIVVRGWATKAVLEKLLKRVINDGTFDYIYRVLYLK